MDRGNQKKIALNPSEQLCRIVRRPRVRNPVDPIKPFGTAGAKAPVILRS